MKSKFLLSLIACLALTLGPVFAQTSGRVTVKGTVVDEASEPVAGAAVVVKGNPALGGVITDARGEFILNVPKGVTLTVSCIGFQEESRKIDQATVWMVTLREDSTLLEDAVVVGYGVQKKESVVGAISQVKADVLEKSSFTSITNALAGKVSNLLSYSANASGAPGENMESLMIRGLSSWNGNEPLVMVDGIERTMNEIAPTEIESISILKDASATAVYGAKGANGVILVTTKTGMKGKPQFHYGAEYGLSSPLMLPVHIDAVSTAKMANVAFANQGSFGSKYTDKEIEAFANGSNPLRYPDTNFYELMMKRFAPSFDTNMSLSGGTDRFKYYLGATYVHEGSILKDIHELGETHYAADRITWRLNLDFNLTKTTVISLKSGGNLTDNQGPITWDGQNSPVSSSSIFGSMYSASTIAYPAYYPAYALEWYPDPEYPNEHGDRIGDRQGYNTINPYSYMVDAAYVRREINRVNTDLIIDQKLDFITKGLSLSGKVGYSSQYEVLKEKVYVDNPMWDINWEAVDMGLENVWIRSTPSNYVWNLKPYGVTSSNTPSNVAWIFYLEGALNYKRQFAKKHNVSALLLYNQRQYNASAAFPKRNQSFVSRLTYDYKSKYLFEFNMGITGSEQFAPKYRYGVFPSVAVGYLVSKEDWWKNAMPWWNTFKIRYSHGVVGSDNSTANWLYYTYWSKVSVRNNGGTFITEGAAANESARWETATKRDLGIEMAWLGGDLSLNLDFFNENRDGILVQPVITMFVATSFKDVNNGAVKKHGMEVELSYRHLFPNRLTFDSSFMLGLSENRITLYEDLPYAPEYQKTQGTPYGSMRKGESLVDDKYFTSVDEIHGYPTYTTSWSSNVVPGAYKFLDYNRDGIINSDDLHTIHGSVYAPGVYSINLGLGYKGFSFSILGTGTIGKYIPINGDAMVPFARGERVVHYYSTDYWTPTNQDATAPVIMFSDLMYSWGGGTIATITNSGYDLGLPDYTWRKSDYFMIKESRLAYKFDMSKINRSFFKAVSVSLTGANLALFSNIIDRNATGTMGSYAVYPQMRTFKLGVSLDF